MSKLTIVCIFSILLKGLFYPNDEASVVRV